ncbi:MAG: hypothetical protein LH609_21635 [Rudanella sp.]|nr:hypothetical protein [Rudanella sp.]
MILHNTPNTASQTIGGKANGLYQLQQLGLSVPPFLVIPAETFDAILDGLPANEPSVGVRRERLQAFVLSEADKAEIARILAEWGFSERAVVVRSSVADEDGDTNAFPGLMDSFLNLTSLPAVYEAVTRCASSACSERAVAYRVRKNLTLVARPAVIIQQQITPVASGVLFTTFPEYPQEMAAHAVFGFGEGLVGGTLDADEFYWLKTSGKLHRRVIATKQQQVVVANKAGLQTVAVSPARQAISCLTDSQLRALFQLGTTIEQTFGRPQDVEFVVTDTDVFVVQARPITQPIPEVIVYDNANIQESYCGVTTPLTFSFASRAYATVYRQTMQTLGLPAARIRAQEGLVTNLLGLVKGRIYYNINNWYRGLQLLPSFRQNKADMERMMGLDEPVDFVRNTEKTTGQKLSMLPGLLVNLSRLLWAFSQLNKRVPAFHTHFQRHYQRFYKRALSRLSNADLLLQKEQLDTNLLGNWSTPIINDFYVMMNNGSVVRKLKRVGVAEPEEFLSRYLSGDKQIESTQPVRAMQQLAVKAREQPDLQVLIASKDAAIHQRMAVDFPAFHKSVSQFIDQYGDRTVGELKLETVTMRLNPQVFYGYLRNYLTADLAAKQLPETAPHLHTGAAAELTRLLANRSAWFRRGVWRTLTRLQRAIRYRESLRLERTRLFGMYRALYLAMGDSLTTAQGLTAARDVFYLTETEILEALRTQNVADLPDRVAHRKAEFAHYEIEDVPSRVTVPSPPLPAEAVAAQQPGVWQGTGCVPGVVTGEVIVITDPRNSLDVTGKIVCALRTDPGWAVLFPTCRGVLIEKGSSLSHSVILLRELGLPTIINVPGLTKTLQSGQVITMNGGSGAINIPT